MNQLNPTIVSAAIMLVPAFARLGLCMHDVRMRNRAADALASGPAERLERQPATLDNDH
ncbi:DUF6771 family protein [uncultured Sphingomonas sp.]|uniref:DUF6771 family protein n=1 Tax=uncultured Sphingomonas sp. TaxID=158754 RepID=UPI0035C9744D